MKPSLPLQTLHALTEAKPWVEEAQEAWQRQCELLQRQLLEALAHERELQNRLTEERAIQDASIAYSSRRADEADNLAQTLRKQMQDYTRAIETLRAEAQHFLAERDAAREQLAILSSDRAAEREASAATAEALRASQVRLERAVASARELRDISVIAAARKTATLPGSNALVEKARSIASIFLAHEKILASPEPDVTVIIPTYRNALMTLDCLESIGKHLTDGTTMQLVVTDDASPSDAISEIAAELPFVTLVRNGTNLGFLRSCNAASLLANGRYIHFLNNDTIVQAGWLSELVACAERDEKIGAVGSRLIFGDGTLQEAGGIVWRDASGWNFGRNEDPEDARYNYVRDVDYCSAASLLIRTSVFRDLGLFDERFAPAYYEDADLCFGVRDRGYRVVIQPKSKVIHLEGKSSGTSLTSGIKQHQLLNAPKFAEKWRDTLTQHYEPGAVSGLQASRRLMPRKTLVVIDSYVPEPNKDAGSLRLQRVMELAQALGYSVIFVPDNYHRSEPYTTMLQNIGIEVVYHTEKTQQPQIEAICERLEFADLVWLCRPQLAERFMPILANYPDVPVIYDTIDLHYVRERREMEHLGIIDRKRWLEWEERREIEFAAINNADITVVVTEIERAVLAEQGMDRVFVIPTIHDVTPRIKAYEETSGVMFIGGYNHTPNVDAAVWLATEIMPIVWRSLPDVELTLIGSNTPASILELKSERVRVLGFVPDVEPYFQNARVFAAPLRYGAGMKGKIGQALSYGVPAVTTRIGAEGFDLVPGSDALIEDNAEAIARAIVDAYRERELWETLSRNASSVVLRFGSEATKARLDELFTSMRSRTTR